MSSFELVERMLPPEWGGRVPTSVFLAKAQRLVDVAQQEGFVLRVVGGVAVRLRSPELQDFARSLGRHTGRADGQEFVDLDFAAYKRQRKALPAFFARLGYIKHRTTMATAMSERHIYFHPDGWFEIDVFFDKMLMEHVVPFRGRLELDYPTLTPTDLFLTKIQVTDLTEKDVKDVWLLLRGHEVGAGPDNEVINTRYVAALLADDWGFWYDATTNLERVRRFAEDSKLLSATEKTDILDKVAQVAQAIEKVPKTLRWKIRSILGTHMQWYCPVEE
jgi:hypothetical protein